MVAEVLQFGFLLGLWAGLRELCGSDYLSMELFNQAAEFQKIPGSKKRTVVNAVFRFTASMLCLLYYIVQTAVCCLIYGLLPGANVRYILVQSILVDYVCIATSKCTLNTDAVRKAWSFFRKGKPKVGGVILITESFSQTDLKQLALSRRGQVDMVLCFYFGVYAQYDTLNVVHCAFLHACSTAFCTGTTFVAALGLIGCDQQLASTVLLPVRQFERIIQTADKVLQGILLTKLILSSGDEDNVTFLILYICILPIMYKLVDVNLGLHL